jgi:hypothetical protein
MIGGWARRVAAATFIAASPFAGNLASAADCSGYADDLQVMLKADEAMRELVDPATVIGAKSAPPALQRSQLVDRVNTRRLEDWVHRCGWPRRSTMGDAAVGAAWLLVQHADQSPAFQARALEMVRSAVTAGEESPSDLAYLSDRLDVAAGRPQLYGTQGLIEGECKFRLLPVDDPKKVDERRKALKWPALDEYKRLVLKTTFGDRCAEP